MCIRREGWGAIYSICTEEQCSTGMPGLLSVVQAQHKLRTVRHRTNVSTLEAYGWLLLIPGASGWLLLVTLIMHWERGGGGGHKAVFQPACTETSQCWSHLQF